jgi:hypothetical protein
VPRRLDSTFRLFREDELQAMRDGLSVVDKPKVQGPKPYSFRFAQICIQNMHRDPLEYGRASRDTVWPYFELNVQLPPGHPVRSMNDKQRVRLHGQFLHLQLLQLQQLHAMPEVVFLCCQHSWRSQ